ncbi:IucA/IucC family C-terminal-domain containing protein [Cohnella mopanensis]|uniref:IucA/IucC family C-terminal-domain containing protein n=1 Tax=Cohnella mopanensis TaxID=2911966 RepID=UPI001EF908FA|nr:IucA/IucC family C-terminal-domain containing protein [Cohnella mopanensis]
MEENEDKAMALAFSPEEIEVLIKDYRLAIEPSSDGKFSMPATDMLNKIKCSAYLEGVAGIFESSSPLATASLFAKRYSYLIIASSLYAMSALNKGMDYAIDNCHIESNYQGQAWLPKARLTNRHVSQPAEGRRAEWRDGIIRNVFADNLAKAWDSLSKSVPISKAVLWENTAIYVYWLYENKFGVGASADQRSRIQEDFEYLINEAPAHLFGESKNPLTRFNSCKVTTLASDEPIRIRKTCCFYYLASDEPEDYCPTCPKIKHEAVVTNG